MLRVQVGRVDEIAPATDGAPDWLCPSERQRWTTLTAASRRAFAASRHLLREALARATGVAADRWQISAEAGVAPVTSRLDRERATVPHVSIAHRLGWVAVAVGAADEGAIGVDIECVRPPRSDPAQRAALLMHGDELARWLALEEAEREPALMRAWIAREAWFKAAGTGAPWDLRRLAFEPCSAAGSNVRIWEAGAVRVALCTRDAAALSAATCDGWAATEVVQSSFWRIDVS